MSELRRTHVEVGGTVAPVIEAGPRQAAEAVMFVHGNPGSSSDWTELVEAVGELGRAVAVDMPGFGKARAPRDFEYHAHHFRPAYRQTPFYDRLFRSNTVPMAGNGHWGSRRWRIRSSSRPW